MKTRSIQAIETETSYTDAEDRMPLDQLRVFYRRTYFGSTAQPYRDFVREIPIVFAPLQVYDTVHGTSFAERARAMFFRFANGALKADGRITKQEEQQLADLKALLWTSKLAVQVEKPASAALQGATTPPPQDAAQVSSRSVDVVLADLRSLVGLEAVKADVLRLVNFLKVQQLRRSKGMPGVTISHHLVFYGNPGTGKTTVARLIAELYRALGILRKGHLIETDRSGLVAGYVGQTALKVREVVNKALGGILFIDEAYALGGRDAQDFGAEAVETLLKFMEDHRDDLAVIVAGYPDRMEAFLTTNPGLKSRFNTYLRFDDYAPDQLCSIFANFCRQAGYTLSSRAQSKMEEFFRNEYNRRDHTFGNARLARNAFERIISQQANRIVGLRDVNQELLATIETDDIPDGARD